MDVYGSEILNNNTNIIELSEDKISHNWGVTLLKGLLCNWFVCLSLWLAASFDTLTDKAVGLFSNCGICCFRIRTQCG